MRTTSRFAITTAMALGLTALGQAASAQPQPRLALPEGVTTDRFSADPWALSLDIGFSNFDGDNSVRYAARVDMYGQILGPVGANRVGGYVSLPYARAESETSGEDPLSELGHLELGGLYATAAGPTTDAVLRGGVAFEVGDDSDLDSLGVLLTSVGRLSEFAISLPEVNWLRLSGSMLHRSEAYFLRGDLGLDLPLGDGIDENLFARLNLAAGVDLDSVALLAELANLTSFGESDDSELLSTLAFTVRVPAGTFSPVAGVVIPLDDALQDFVDFVVVVGVRAAGE